MFTGLVERTSVLRSLNFSDKFGVDKQSAEIVLDLDNFDCDVGDSISVNGCCLTVSKMDQGRLFFDVSAETLDRTSIGKLKLGALVNIERALQVNARLGGHLVSGHVDSLAKVLRLESSQGFFLLDLEISPSQAMYVIEKGSVCIDGVSLTINALKDSPENCQISLCLIPKTLEATALKELHVDSFVNIEFDMLGKYILRSAELQKK